jgi:membrane protease YdiL (CAAX protease family)
MSQIRDLRPLLFLGILGFALLLIDLFLVKTNLSLPPLHAAPKDGFIADAFAGILSSLLLVFPCFGFYQIVTGRITSAPVLLGGLTLLAGFLSGGGTVSALLQGMVNGLAVFGIAQSAYAGRLPLRDLLPTPRRLLYGLCAFGAHLAVGLLFLWTATLLGASGDDTALRERISTSPWPWLLPIAIGLSAALFEELVFRKWMDNLLSRFTRSWAPAALLSSLLWSLTHLQYTVSPWYLRLIEITLFAGPVSFWIYKKYGLYTAVLGHALYNAFLVSIMVSRIW